MDDTGRVVHFSAERLVADIIERHCCFICGAQAECKPFNDEHVVPDWLLRRYCLHNKHIELPNGTRMRYDRYKIACCVECNSMLGEHVEDPVSQILTGNYQQDFLNIARSDRRTLHIWLSLLLTKTHIKSSKLRSHLDMRRTPEMIGDIFDWGQLHHAHCVARSAYTGCRLVDESLGSLFVFPVQDYDDAPFGYTDLFRSQVIMIRLRQTCLISVIDDGGGVLSCLKDLISDVHLHVRKPLDRRQAGELLARISYASQILLERPRMQTDLSRYESEGSISIEAVLPGRPPRMGPWNPSDFGKLMSHLCADLIADENSDVRAAILEGRYTFIQNADGQPLV